MIDIAKKSATQIFNHGVLTTFGKLDSIDIAQVDGRSEQLVPIIMKYYGWSSELAQIKTDQFMTRIANQSR